jgi:transposase
MDKAKEIPNIEVQDIDHLGIIAGIIDDIGMVEIINKMIGEHPQELVSAGHVVKALILNCMGFLSAPLYLFSQFFIGKATEHLLGEGIQPEHLNPRRIGRVLDKLYRYGITTIFMTIALKVVKKFGVSMTSVHGDSSSFYVHGEYESGEGEAQTKDEPDFIPIEIKRGYSRDHRPDLKQFTLNLLTSTDGDIPLGLRVGDGNEVDTQVLVPFMKQWRESWEELGGETPQVMAGDAALFTEDNLEILGDLSWISRVPARIAEAIRLMQTLAHQQFQPFQNSRLQDYRFCEVCTIYGTVAQRWIIVESHPRLRADLKKLDKKLAQETKKQNRALDELKAQEFACEADAFKAGKAFEKKLNFHLLFELKIEAKAHYQKRGRPSKEDLPSYYSFHVQAQLKLNPEVVQAHRNQAGRFIVATNILDEQSWKPEKVVLEYKDQTCERGFRFLKDPLFFVSRVFLKSPKRIMVLMMVMGLALLVYSIGQRHVRQTLATSQETLADQKGKQTEHPTLRWLLQCFLSVHLVWVDGVKTLIKLTERQRRILDFLSPNCRKYYLFC